MANAAAYYNGGCCFRNGTNVTVLARYPDGTAAIIAKPFGQGEVVLSGIHLERPAPSAGNAQSPPPASAGAIYRALARL